MNIQYIDQQTDDILNGATFRLQNKQFIENYGYSLKKSLELAYYSHVIELLQIE